MSYWSDDLGGTRIKQKLHFEDHGKHNAVLESVQDCTPLLDENQRIRNDYQPGVSRHGTRIAARIPEIYYYVKWPQEFEQRYGYSPRQPPPHIDRREAEKNWRDFVIVKLNDPDFNKLRVDNGERLSTKRSMV